MKKIRIINEKNNKKSIIIGLILICVLIAIDQLTKYLASNNELLINGEKIIFIKHILSFRLAYNTGAAWSILTGKKLILCTMSVIASIVCTFFFIKYANFNNNIFLTIVLILIDAGAIGNGIDRIFYADGVIDFLCFEFIDFPIFNIADSCLTVGAIGLVIYMLFFYKDPKSQENIPQEEVEGENNG